MTSDKRTIPFSLYLAALACLILMHAPMEPAAEADELSNTCEAQGAVIAVHCAAEGLGALCRGQEDPGQRIDLIRHFIEPIRFYPDRSGYFYVYDLDCRNIAHATQKDLVGKNLYDYQDAKGKYVIRELAEAARVGGGFVTYHWIKPGSEGEKLKLGYVEPIPGTEYFIGTGVYESSMTESGAAPGEKHEQGR
ncbi:putative cache sensor protein [uncultured Desulfatiglans sp.]|nr:putative cache sensor protein [uncultured Desulfatiglans sp.]